MLKRTEDDLDFFLERVSEIIEAVRLEGDTALARFGARFDKAESLTSHSILATKSDFEKAFNLLPPELIETLEYAADNIRRFHEYQKPEPQWHLLLQFSPQYAPFHLVIDVEERIAAAGATRAMGGCCRCFICFLQQELWVVAACV